MAIRDDIIKALRQVRDPEIPVNIYDLGLIYELLISDDGTVQIEMTLTTPNCPMAEVIPGQVAAAVRAVEGVSDVHVDIVWEPPWTPERMSEAAKLELEFTGQTGPWAQHKKPFTDVSIRHTPRKRE